MTGVLRLIAAGRLKDEQVSIGHSENMATCHLDMFSAYYGTVEQPYESVLKTKPSQFDSGVATIDTL